MQDLPGAEAVNTKTIYTAYFGIAKRLPADIPQISIARWDPLWWSPPGGRRKERLLVPDEAILANYKRYDELYDWRTAFLRQIRRAGILEQAIRNLPDRCILLCWEKCWNDCHRKLVWDALHEKFGVVGGELSPDETGQCSGQPSTKSEMARQVAAKRRRKNPSLFD